MNHVNIRKFEFDFDTTWASFFLDEKLNVYSRYGGRDEGEPEDRLSKDSLMQTMQEVLDIHKQRRQLRQENKQPIVQPVEPGVQRPEDITLLKKNQRGCVHCHQVKEYQVLQWNHDKEFSRRKLFGYPLPENLGLKVDRNHGHRIDTILPDSAAAKSKLQPGDEIVQVNDVPIHSEFDIRWALHRASDSKPIELIARREEGKPQTVSVSLRPGKGWRGTDISWRKSMRSLPMEFGFRGYSLTRSQRKADKLSEEQLAIRVVSARDRGLSLTLGIQKRDVIIALDGVSKRRKMEEFKSDVLNRYKPGDEVTLTILREGKRIALKGKLPEWGTAETTVP